MPARCRSAARWSAPSAPAGQPGDVGSGSQTSLVQAHKRDTEVGRCDIARPREAHGYRRERGSVERMFWSGREDLNLRLHRPERCALPGCATPRPPPARIARAFRSRNLSRPPPAGPSGPELRRRTRRACQAARASRLHHRRTRHASAMTLRGSFRCVHTRRTSDQTLTDGGRWRRQSIRPGTVKTYSSCVSGSAREPPPSSPYASRECHDAAGHPPVRPHAQGE